MSSLCGAHSPRVTKANHLPLPMNMLSLVCMVPWWEGSGSPSYPPLSPHLVLYRWASLKVKHLPKGICKGKWMRLPYGDDFITLSA